MATEQLTEAQRRLLHFIADCIDRRGWAPTMREMQGRFGWRSSASAASHLAALAKKEVIQRGQRSGRAIRITEAGRKALR